MTSSSGITSELSESSERLRCRGSLLPSGCGRCASLALLVLSVALSLAVRASAQITLPGGIRVQVPNARPGANRPTYTRADPEKVCPNLVGWVKPLFTEYPGQDLMRVELGQLAVMEIPLFADKNFVPFFKKSYTAMSPQELDGIFRQQIVPCNQSTYRTQIPGVEYAFQIRSTNSPLSYTRLPGELTTLQQGRETLERQEAALASLPATVQSYDSLQSIRSSVASALPAVWPSERELFRGAVTSAQARLAPAVLKAKVDTLLAAPSSVETLRALRAAPSRYGDLFGQVPAEEAQGLRQSLDARFSEVGATLLVQQRKTMLSFSGTREGLKEGASWLQSFQSIYVNQLSVPGATEVASEYERSRERQMAGLEPELRRRLQAAQSEEALQPMLEEAYPLRSDRATPEYASMQQAVALRAAVFQQKEAAAQQARNQAEAARQAQFARQTRPARSTAETRSAVARTPGPAADAPLSASAFSARGLENDQILTSMFRGEFEKIDFGRDDLTFGSMISGYMDAYWDSCQQFLTEDRLPITEQQCTGGSSHWVNGYGMQISPDTCNGWSDVPTGKFADRQLYRASKAVEGQQTKNGLGMVLSAVTGAKSLGDMMSGTMNKVTVSLQLKNDVAAAIESNGCTSPGLRRFQNNLMMFALGKQGIHLDGTQPHYVATEGASGGGTFKDSDYRKVLEDMVSDQSKTWVLNRYVNGSVSDIEVSSRDTLGRPTKVSARYAYTGMSGKQQGSVALSFSDGLPECLYFSDLPSNCATPNRKLIAAYGSGAYR